MAAPHVTAIAPASGPAAGGTLVDVTGTGFDTATAVAFGTTAATDFHIVSATRILAIAPAGTGTDAILVTNPDGTNGSVPACQFSYSDGVLFSVADARAYVARGTCPLSDTAVYSDAAVTACEAAIRELAIHATGIDLFPTTYTETLDGNPTNVLRVSRKNPAKEHPRRVITVSAASIDGTALSATELAAIRARPDGRLVRTDGQSWSSSTGYQDLAVSVTYTVGWAAVPEMVKRAALQLALQWLVGTDVPERAITVTDGGATYQFPRPGSAPHWTGYDEVDAVLSEFREDRVVIA